MRNAANLMAVSPIYSSNFIDKEVKYERLLVFI